MQIEGLFLDLSQPVKLLACKAGFLLVRATRQPQAVCRRSLSNRVGGVKATHPPHRQAFQIRRGAAQFILQSVQIDTIFAIAAWTLRCTCFTQVATTPNIIIMSSEKYASSLSDTAVGSEPPSPVQGIRRSSTNGSYHKLASFMGTWSDVAIFRRFGALNAQNLLYLQAEITHLERELEVVRRKEESTERGLQAQRSWFELSQDSEEGQQCRQWLVVQDIREKLAEYSL